MGESESTACDLATHPQAGHSAGLYAEGRRLKLGFVTKKLFDRVVDPVPMATPNTAGTKECMSKGKSSWTGASCNSTGQSNENRSRSSRS